MNIEYIDYIDIQLPYMINLGLTELSGGICRHLKLELLTQFPASNDEKYSAS